MKVKQLKWRYNGSTDALWVGEMASHAPPIRFVLEQLSGDRYVIRSEVNGIPKSKSVGLIKAKAKAQSLLEKYVMSFLLDQ